MDDEIEKVKLLPYMNFSFSDRIAKKWIKSSLEHLKPDNINFWCSLEYGCPNADAACDAVSLVRLR
jgi:hypothetical protein